MKNQIKSEKAITLIALIITIIILVILAAVSIRAVYNMGIVNYAVNGTEGYTKASKQENNVMKDTESYLEDAVSRVKSTQGGDDTITVPEELRTYVLGAEGTGRALSEILSQTMSSTSFINEASTIADARTSVVLLNDLVGDNKEEAGREKRIYVRYNNVGYKIMVNSLTSNTTGVEVAYVPKGREGEIVQYSVDGTSAEADWLVLYDNGSTLDITPVSIDNSWTYTLGKNDPNATGSTDLEKAMDSYENVVERLNRYCGTIVTNPTKVAVRSIGTQFNQEDTTTRYSSTFLENNPTSTPGTYNGVGKVGDYNIEQDVIRMSYYSTGGTGNGYTKFGYAKVGSNYWLASRNVYGAISGGATFIVRSVASSGQAATNCQLWGVSTSGANSRYVDSAMVRPVARVAATQFE